MRKCDFCFRVHGVCTSGNVEYFYQHVNELIRDFGLNGLHVNDICDVIEGYNGIGYAKSTDEELSNIKIPSTLNLWPL